MQTANAHHRLGSTQSHQRRPEDHARVTRCACGVMLLPTIDRHPAPRSLCFTCYPFFTRCRPSTARYDDFFRGTPPPITVGETGRRCSYEHDELCLFRAVRRTKVGAEASLPRVPLPPRVVLRPCAQLQKRQGSARPWPLFVPW